VGNFWSQKPVKTGGGAFGFVLEVKAAFEQKLI
jgi:hypothetical protein